MASLLIGRLFLLDSDTIIRMTTEMNDGCIPNINLAERRKRLRSGFVMLAVGLVVLIGLIYFGLSLWWRLVLFPLFVGGMSGFFQWRDQT